MRLWHKIFISGGAVLVCLILGTLMTQPFSALPARVTLNLNHQPTVEADTGQTDSALALAQAQQQAQSLQAQIHILRAQAAVEQKAAEPVVRFLYQYHSGGASTWLQTVLSASDFSDAVSNVAELTSLLRHDQAVLQQLASTEHVLTQTQVNAAAANHEVSLLTLQQGSEQARPLLTGSVQK